MQTTRRCIAVLLFLLCALGPAPSLARDGCCTSEVEFLGWTRDSRFFAYRETTSCRQTSEDEPGVSSISDPPDIQGIVVEAASGNEERFDLVIAGKRVAGAKKFAAWRAAHPPAPVQERSTAPDGARRWVLTGKSGRDLSEVVEGGLFGNTDETLGEEYPISLDVRVRGKLWSGQAWRPADCMGMPSGTAFGRWSPDNRHVAWFAEEGTCTYMGGCGEQHVTMYVGAGGPSIQVLADAALPPAALAAARSALKLDGYSLLATGTAQDHRTRSVVYARKGLEGEGRKVAAAVPGGAAVEPLTWNAPYDLVVALGTDAGGGG